METTYQKMKLAHKSTQLARHICLPDMGCALFEIKGKIKPIPPSDLDLFLCTDFVQESSVDNFDENTKEITSRTLTILRRLDFQPLTSHPNYAEINENYQKLLWLPCFKKYLSEIKLFISDEKGNIPSFEFCELTCTLLFIANVHSI